MSSFDRFYQTLVIEIINPLVLAILGIAALVFIWGVVEFIAQSGNPEARTTGKKHMVWGIVGLAIMFGVWSIVRILISLVPS